MMGPHATKTPIFMGHGTADQVVAYKFGTMTQKFMTDELKIPSASDNDLMGLKFNTYSGLPHSVNEKELAHLSEWLKKVVPDV
jgi:predicted esterase